MSSIHGTRGVRRGRGGCPPMLAYEPVPTDSRGPSVEWPEGPPTRAARHASARRTEPDVGELTTTRAIHLLDASLAHLRTALETREDPDPRLEDAVAELANARDTLLDIDLRD